MATTSTSADDTHPSPTLVKHSTKNAPHPFIDTTVASMNAAPVELDSTPISPVARKESWKVKGATAVATVSPDMEEETYGELSGEKGENEVSREVQNHAKGAYSHASN